MISRRQFFRRFISPLDKKTDERRARYDVMETYVRNHLLPYDFELTAEQDRELFAAVRGQLEKASDVELFSVLIRGTLEEAVELKLRPWREAARKRAVEEKLREIRTSAPDYVNSFLTFYATGSEVDTLKQRFEIDDFVELERALQQHVREWIAACNDEQLLNYDVFTVKDLVFIQLRSWC